MQFVRHMISRIGRTGGILVVAAIVFAGGLGLGTGLSSTGAQTGNEISGCVSNYTGALRIPSGNGQCASFERPLSWNEQGPSGLLDIQIVEERETVTTDDQTNRATVLAECPSGYRIIGGGSGFGGASGNDFWAMRISNPFEAGELNRDNDGWRGNFITLDGDDAEGSYLFTAKAICALTSTSDSR